MAARAACCSAICRPSRESSRKALVSGDYRSFALFSCFVNGEPAAAIAAVNKDGGNYAITPLFVSVTSSLMLTDHDGRPAGEEAH
jgi:hypothetical protein